jgi:NADH-quinone oxidoreductase subunit L
MLWLIPGLPLAAAVLTAFFGPRFLRKQSHWPCVLAVAGSCVLSVLVLIAVVKGGQPAVAEHLPLAPDLEKKINVITERNDSAFNAPILSHRYIWFQIGNVDVTFSLQADGLTALMLVTVTFVSSLIAIYSIGYMSHERQHNEGYSRFFAEIALFVFSMTGLVLADNFILLYAFWEGVGLCSYLLIGFWFAKPSAAAAARKAFLVTRLGDIGLFLGIVLLWAGYMTPGVGPIQDNLIGGLALGTSSALDYGTTFRWAGTLAGSDFMAVVALLLLCGAVGKSAQFPLYVWLPDAMEGPTPVSALIHAATMVTAGVYLVARCMPIFHAAPAWVLLVVAAIGAFTSLLAALIALTQNDLKRVLAYSTISQLGYMFLALGSGTTAGLVLLAVVAAIFHLFTHAFFKALLFLSAGSVMHSMGNVIDMRRFSGLRHVLPVTHWTFLCGAIALAGLPPFSGFWSKDEILGVALSASNHHYGTAYTVLFISGVITAGLTAFYTFRAYFLTFTGEVRVPPEAGEHAHESPPVMIVPLVILAIGAAALGMVVQPFTHWFSTLLEWHWMPGAFTTQPLTPEPHGLNVPLMLGSTAFALGGFLTAWWMYVNKVGLADRVAQAVQGLYQLSLNKFHVDELYDALMVKPLSSLAGLCRVFDLYGLDSLVDLVGHVPRLIGMLLRPIQNGLVQFYALAMILGLTVFLGALVLRLAW